MPLLKRKAFEKSTASEYLRDDDEVFHCELTDEIFKDYEEYCERIILVNSMVWTCEMTGKNNLTYSEALQSEKDARKLLKDFPMELRIPILYLAMKTSRCSFAEMSEDVFNFVRDRYFVGESVEACLEGDQWHEAHVLSVTAQKQHPDNKATLPAASYVYEVEQYSEQEAASEGQVCTAPFDRVRRRKGLYTRDKNRLFLKQFVQHGPNGIISIKKSTLEKYNIHKVIFDQIFTGNPPIFEPSKKLLKSTLSPGASKNSSKPGSASKLNTSVKKPSPDKKGRQESMDKFVKKANKTEAPKPKGPVDPAVNKSAKELAAKMRLAENLLRQRKEEEKAKKENTARLQAYLKEWQKVKDDLELEDHKIIPKGTAIDIEGVPQKHFGDFLSVLEFVHMYADILKAKDVFHSQLDVDTFRKALTLKEHAGLFCDLVQMLLSAIFSLQEDEAEGYNESKGIQLSTGDKPVDVGVAKATVLATKASKWSQTYLGTPLSKLQLDPTTVSEVLRLHLLSSGAAGGSRCAAWRYQQRGGYSSTDDAGLRLRIASPHLLAHLARTHVADLPLGDKLLILQCLMNQIISYATVRDVIEEKLDEFKNSKHALRMMQIQERKREAQVLAARQDLRKEAATLKEQNKLSGAKAKLIDEQLKIDIEKLQSDNEEKRKEYEKKVKELQTGLFGYSSYLGMDRAYRRYWLNRAVAGLFVEAGDEPRGDCRDKPVPPPLAPPATHAAHPHAEDTLAYVTRLFETQKERGGSDKENESAANSRGSSPKKPLVNLNGMTQKMKCLELASHQLLVCSGDVATCSVHGKVGRPQWWVYHTEEQIEALIESLNKRGLRETELRQTLELDKDNIVQYLRKCPVHLLNPAAATAPAAPVHQQTRRKHFQPSLVVPPDCSLSETLELSLREHILELEQRIFHGCLGALNVKDREAWRGTIMLRGYDKQAGHLSWGPGGLYRDDYHLPDGVLSLPPGIGEEEMKEIAENKYRDPGFYLEAPRANGVKAEPGGDGERAPRADVVRGLAGALLQVSQAINHKYLKRPLGLEDKERKEREARGRGLELDALHRWEVSLMECRSFAQVALHLLALDSSVSWAASVLYARCRLCRRKADPKFMLLCDSCNKGHHLYCLKPKLTKVPEGDWFCDECRPKERAPRKRRKLFSEDDLDESINSEAECIDEGVCGACGSGGALRTRCHGCEARYHAECAEPRPTRAAKRWLCAACLPSPAPSRSPSPAPSPAPAPARAAQAARRCAVAARSHISEYARALHARPDSSESEDSEYTTALVTLKGARSRSTKDSSPGCNGDVLPRKRGRKPKHEQQTSGRKSKNSLTNGAHEEGGRAERRRKRSQEALLHGEALAQLLRDTMKHRDCWPFLEPVSVEEVPDYLQVIEQPMDLSTIVGKLESAAYCTDEQAIEDLALVFRNCYTYNDAAHAVARAGTRLEKYVNKRCAELDLLPLPLITLQDDDTSASAPASGPASSPSATTGEDTPLTKKHKAK